MSQQIQISGGAKVRDLQDVIIGTSGVLSSLAFNVANGVPKLDSNGKILVSQLPNSVMEYLGTWNASTNTPTLANGTGNQGDVWLCTTPGTVNFGAGPITFIVGDSAIYSGSIWQRSGGATGSVTSVGLSTNGGAITIGNSPVTTSGTITANFNGTNLQYVNGAGNLTTFPTLITSIGLSMPSAFSVSNSPLTANGTIAVTGAGTTAQYIRGDGSLATFPTIATEAQRLITEVYNETGATLSKGTVVYINGGHGNLPTITKALATGDATSAQTYGIVQTDITNMNNGYVVVIGSLTDLDTSAYVEGTQLYLSSTTAGAWTSVKQYAPAHLVYVAIVTRSHPTQGVVEVSIQNGFEMDELHNVSAQSPLNNQGLFYNTSTSLWENKSIATALGYTPADDSLVVKLAGTQTITGAKTFSSTALFDTTTLYKKIGSPYITSAGYTSLQFTGSGTNTSLYITDGDSVTSNRLIFKNNAGYDYTFPAASGTISLTSDLANYVNLTTAQTISGVKTFSTYQLVDGGILIKHGANVIASGYTGIGSTTTGLIISLAGGGSGSLIFNTTSNYQYTFPNATGTIALVGGSGVGTVTSVAALTIGTTGTDLSSSVANSTTTPVITLNVPTASATNRGALSSADWTTFNNKQSALTNPVTGTGTTNYLPKFTGTSTIGNSLVYDNASFVGINTTTNGGILSINGTDPLIGFQNAGSTKWQVGLENTASDRFIWYNNAGAAYRMILTSSGNLGLGVTPSAWSTGKAIDIGSSGAVFGDGINTAYTAGITQNGYLEANVWKYKISSQPTGRYEINGASHAWYNAPSGTAGAAITFTQAMTLTASGRLLIGTPTEASYLLDVNGTGRFSNSVTFAGSVYNFVGTNRFFAAASGSINYLYTGSTNLTILNQADTATLFTLANSGAATFSGDVTLGGSAVIFGTTGSKFYVYPAFSTNLNLLQNYNGSAYTTEEHRASDYSFKIGTTAALTIASTGAATFSSSVTAGGVAYISGNSNAGPIPYLQFTDNYGSAGRNWALINGYDNYGTLSFKVSTAIGGNPYSGTSVLSMTQGGNVGIGTSSPSEKLTVYGAVIRLEGAAGVTPFAIANNNSDGFRIYDYTAAATRFTIATTGAATFTGSVTATSFFESSSIKGKDIIATNPLLALDIDVIKYTRKSDESKDIRYGYSAEQIHSLMPELTDKDVTAVKYLDVHTILIANLQKEIKELKAKINN